MHPKWQERHVRHFRDALAALEAGEGAAACYNAYVSVEALLKGILGFSPYGDLHRLERLPSLLEKALGGKAPPEVEKCAECLERKAFSDEEVRCVKCTEVILEALYGFSSSIGVPSRRP
jgi:HEPN domain-containing protein